MSEELQGLTLVSRISFFVFLTIAVICVSLVKGCSIVYDPASLKADAEARVLVNDNFHKWATPSPSPSPSPISK